MGFSKEVKTPNGNVKNVVADTREELDRAVEAVMNEPKTVTPDIDNPAHGNVVVKDFVADPEKALSERPPEHFPTSEASKELSNELAGKTKEERREIVNEVLPGPHENDGHVHVDEDKDQPEKKEAKTSDKKVDKTNDKK